VRIVLVTGANTGIGYAISERPVRDGSDVGFATPRENLVASLCSAEVAYVTGELRDRRRGDDPGRRRAVF
jgi:NAD(P)-dependent dehydrogenase (short-subunit alcohol dehydrogenase family)